MENKPLMKSLNKPLMDSPNKPLMDSLNKPLMKPLNTTPTHLADTATPSSTSLSTTTDVKVKLESDAMEAPTSVDRRGPYLRVWGCPLCHRDPIEPRVANCGHIFCLMCLKDVQVTAELFRYPPRCNLCHEDISDQHPIAFNSQRTLPPLAPAISSPSDGRDGRERLPPRGPTVGEALMSLHQRAQDPRNFYASGSSGLHSVYQHQHQQQYLPHSQQLPLSQPMTPRYDGPQGYLGHMPSSDQIVNTIEHSPRGSVSSVSETKASQSVSRFSFKNLQIKIDMDGFLAI